MRSLVLSVCVVALVGCGKVGSVASGPGKDWTHRELLAHLRSKGLEVKEGRTGTEGPNERPFAYYFWNFDPETVRSKNRVKVILEATEQDAKDRAGTDNAFAWGRFRFEGSDESLKEVRSRLP